MRLGRTLRVIRTMGMFRQLRVLLNTISVSFGSFFWSMLTLFIFMLMGALLLCQVSQDFLLDPAGDPEEQAWVSQHYGTAFRAFYTMFEATFSGCWPNYARRLVENVSVLYAAFFFFYVTSVVFATVRIISALFLKDTLNTASRDTETIIHEKMQEARTMQTHLEHLFQAADRTGTGRLNWAEFERILGHPKVKVWITSLGLDAHDTRGLFDALDQGDGELGWEDFCTGMVRLKGSVRPQDIIRIERLCARTFTLCDDMHTAVSRMRDLSPIVLQGV